MPDSGLRGIGVKQMRVLLAISMVAISAAITILVAFWGQDGVPAKQARARGELAKTIDFNALYESITQKELQRLHAEVVKETSRLSGTPREQAVSKWVEEEFKRLGLRVLIQSYPVTVPITKYSRIIDKNGDELPHISISPMWPNLVRTCTTKPGGITGPVIDVGGGTLEELDGLNIRNKIALVTMQHGFEWLDTAKLGASAILFRSSPDPLAYRKKFLDFPADMPRFLVTGDVESLIGKHVRIEARVDWEIRETRNVYGILDPLQPSTEAVTLMANTDSWSVVPDQAPGYQDGCSLASMVSIARALAGQRGGLLRTTIFVAHSGRYQASAGIRRMTDAIGGLGIEKQNYDLLHARLQKLEKQKLTAQAVAAAIEGLDYWALDEQKEAALWTEHGLSTKRTLSTVVRRLITQYATQARKEAERARVHWIADNQPTAGQSYDKLIATSERRRRAASAISADMSDVKQYFEDVLEQAQIQSKFFVAVQDMVKHAEAEWRYQRDTIQIADLLGPFEQNYYFSFEPSSQGGQLGYGGDITLCTMLEGGRNAIVASWLRWRGMNANDAMLYPNYLVNVQKTRQRRETHREESTHPSSWVPAILRAAHRLEADWQGLLIHSRNSAFLFSSNAQSNTYQTPLDRHVNFNTLTNHTQMMAAMAAQVASGVEQMDRPGKALAGVTTRFSDFSGQVMTAGTSNSLLPSERVPDAIIVHKAMGGQKYWLQKTRNGVFRFPAVAHHTAGQFIAEAYTIDEVSGQLSGAKDLGPEGQRFPTKTWNEGRGSIYEEIESNDMTILLARVAPTDIYRTIDPEGRAVTVEVLDARFRMPPSEYSLSEFWEQGATIFMPPGDRFYLVWKDLPTGGNKIPSRVFGIKGFNDRGFALGHNENSWSMRENMEDFWGPGYLSGHDRRIVFQDMDTAVSVAMSNAERIKNQIRTGVDDDVTVELNQRAEHYLERGLEAYRQKDYSAAFRNLNNSMSVSVRAYPEVRLAVFDAVGGIMLYMFLIVPFSFFAERIIFGFPDIRARLAGMLGIFLLVFAIIRITHPAYELLSSSLVVLVGFIIFILCLMILSFVFGKFAERVRTLRRAGGSGEDAGDSDTTHLGTAGAAFTLGINNMRKRKVRTACTVATLVLICFCLVCFTAPRPQLKDRRIAVGSSGFNGLILREGGDVRATQLQFKDRAKVISRRKYYADNLTVSYKPPQGPIRHAQHKGVIYLQTAERLISNIDSILLPGGKWFKDGDTGFCYISDVTAGDLGIDPAHLKQGNVSVVLRGQRRVVNGIFDSRKLEALRDIDKESLLPGLEQGEAKEKRSRAAQFKRFSGQGGQQVSVERTAGSEVILLPFNANSELPRWSGSMGQEEQTSAVILFNNQPYGSMRELIDQMLYRSPTFVRYAIDGLAFYGARLRSIGLQGYADIVIPLLVGSFIVFNTMLGSVYERKKEISIYSAVGLSPRHVFYLFLAESLVYAIIGVVGGYLLALSLQWISQLGGGFLGLDMNYSSRSAIYVSLTLMAAVIVSSFVPAYQAARVAAPSENISWTLPQAQMPGQLRFDLPFTYIGRDIIAAVPFIRSWFDAHGEDSSGEFSASAPNIQVDWVHSRPELTIATTVWLRPYDLGVSQSVKVSVQPSSDPTIYQVTIDIRQLSGSETSWRRTNDRFVRLLRRHLLSWRALPQQGKQHLAEKGARLLVPVVFAK